MNSILKAVVNAVVRTLASRFLGHSRRSGYGTRRRKRDILGQILRGRR